MENQTEKRPVKWVYIASGALLALAVVAGALVFGARQVKASVSEKAAFFPGGPGRGDPGDGEGLVAMYMENLASELGITVDDLQAAFEDVRAAALQQALDAGEITQEQFDWMQEHARAMADGEWPMDGQRPDFEDMPGPGAMMDAVQSALADTLGVSVEELEAAQEEAQAARLADAVEAGDITQEEADAILSGESAGRPGGRGHGGLMPGRASGDEYLADALGITVEELQTAHEEARTVAFQQLNEEGLVPPDGPMSDGGRPGGRGEFTPMWSMDEMVERLADALGVSVEELQAAHEAALSATAEQAVEEGLLTQEQADQVLSGDGFGFPRPGPDLAPNMSHPFRSER
ncbi:MAG: hypothetical protein JXJ17_08350 [Anaerolineae bacterium]|nr:hypothetical protein [Anaerolineae bacterium]